MVRRAKVGGRKRTPRKSKNKRIKRKATKEVVKESLEHLLHQKEEIETLLSSLEDAYNEAAILEEDYQQVRKKNEEKLAEINKKIEKLRAKEIVEKPEPKPVAPAAAAPPKTYVERPVAVVGKEEPPKKTKGVKEEEKFKKIMEDAEEKITGKIKEMIEAAKTKESNKDLTDIRARMDKFEIDIEKLKALVETVKESGKVVDEKIQRVTESMGELRSIIYQREAFLKEEEVKVSKLMDSISQVEPEKIVMEMKKKDRDISNLGMRVERIERTIEALNDTMTRMRDVLVNIGSLEAVINSSKKVAENIQFMENMKKNLERSAERVQSIYAELSERMEEFLLYKTKQDRMEDLVNELMRSVDDVNNKLSKFITRDDLEAFKQTLAPSAGEATGDVVNDLQIQKEEIKMLIKTLEDEYKNKRVSKEEFEKAKKVNLEKLEEIERKIKEAEGAPAPDYEKPEVEGLKEKEAKAEEIKPLPPRSPEVKKSRRNALLKDLEDTFKKGFISKEAYEKTKKIILSGKG